MIKQAGTLLAGLLLYFCSSYSLAEETQVMNGVDDGTVHINLGHTFPYYGGIFTDAWMSSNGFILLYDPVSQFGNPSTNNNGCCSGFNPSGYNYAGNSFSYMLAPLWTDLRHNTSILDSGYFYETGTDGTAFLWKNITEYGTNNLNTFGVQLWPDGSFDFHYADVNVTQHSVWIGYTGDTTSLNGNVYDEVTELFYGQGSLSMDDVASFASETYEIEGNTYYAWYGQDGGYESNAGPDCSNPLNDPSCEGYDEAYFNQQCEQNPLYDQGCSGYEEAYYNQQCSEDPLYDQGCSGYEEAYYNQQCNNDPLYDSGCPGYEEAYYDQQCSYDPLYDSGCPGYAEAYYDQQCSYDPLYDSGCPGYEEAYYSQQCSLDPLYDSGCPGYEEAYFDQQCSLDALYDEQCPGYTEAYFDQQCELDALYDQTCPGYEEANAIQNATGQDFVFGDEISDFYDMGVEEFDATTTDMGVTDESIGFVDETMSDSGEVFIEEAIINESLPEEEQFLEETLVEEVFEEPIDEETLVEEEIFEEITPMEEEVSNLEEELLIEEEIVEEIVEEEEEFVEEFEKEEEPAAKSEKISRNTLELVLDIVQTVTIIQNAPESAQSEELSQELEAKIDALEQDLAQNQQSSVQDNGETPQESIESFSSSSMEMEFEQNFNDAIATGQNIGEFLSGTQPNFQAFDVKPPSSEEQETMAKAESVLSEISQQDLEDALQSFAEEIEESGGFEGDQRITLLLMSYVKGFDMYTEAQLRDQLNWYRVKKIYEGKNIRDSRSRSLRLMYGGQKLHEDLVNLQYE